MKGGVARIDEYNTKEKAINQLFQNCNYTILTNSSISCITFQLTVKGEDSPFESIRPPIFGQKITNF